VFPQRTETLRLLDGGKVMKNRSETILLVVLVGMIGAGCSSPAPTSMPAAAPISKSATAQQPAGGARGPKRVTPVVAGRPARVFVMTAFNRDCSTVVPQIEVDRPPAKGSVTFKPNQLTTVTYSASGNCIGRRLPGTGIYYTARNGTNGSDTFSIIASADNGPPARRIFMINIRK